MAQRFRGQTVDGVARTQWPAVHREASKHAYFEILILNEAEAITDRQRRWYKGICLKELSDWNGDTVDEWDFRLKTECGAEIFKMLKFEYSGKEFYRPQSITSVGKKQMTQFIENILSWGITNDIPIYPPDPDLRKV